MACKSSCEMDPILNFVMHAFATSGHSSLSLILLGPCDNHVSVVIKNFNQCRFVVRRRTRCLAMFLFVPFYISIRFFNQRLRC